MTIRQRLAPAFFQQDTEIPRSGLPLAKLRHEYADSRHRWDQQVLDELDENAVYEWRWDDEDQVFHANRCEIAALTAKQVQLAERFTGDSDRQTHPPEQLIEMGAPDQQDRDQWRVKYAFGRAIRPKLEEQLASSVHGLEASSAVVERIEERLANRERHSPLGFPTYTDTLTGRPERSLPEKVNWQKEGF